MDTRTATFWVYVGGYTFRGTCASKEVVVHKGDFKGSHVTAGAFATVTLPEWHDPPQLRRRAETWLRGRSATTQPRRTRG